MNEATKKGAQNVWHRTVNLNKRKVKKCKAHIERKKGRRLLVVFSQAIKQCQQKNHLANHPFT